MTKIKKSFFLVCFCLTQSIYSQDIKQKLGTAFSVFETQSAMTNGISSFAVMDNKTNQIVFEKNSKLGLPTASTLKVITSITALDILGSDYTFKTTLSYTGEIDSVGTLHGDIIIEGSGDPTLASDRFPNHSEEILLNKWIFAIQKTGITAINGRIIGDDRLYHGNNVPGNWIWTDIGNYYGAGVSALNWQENKVGIVFNPKSVGQPALIRKMNSDLSYLEIINEVSTGRSGSGDQVYAYSSPYSTKIYLRGTYGQDLNKTIEISVPDPAYFAANQLKNNLKDNNIEVNGFPTTGKILQEQDSLFGRNKKIIDTHESPKLSEIIYWFNQKSINLFGEVLLKTIGRISANKMSSEESADLVAKYWQQKLNISTGELRAKDGSGLSPQNRITSSAMLRIMHYARNRPWYDVFYKSLPTINGMQMKSGTIEGTLGYTGYHKSATGQDYTFVILVNNYQGSAATMRQQIFKVLDGMK